MEELIFSNYQIEELQKTGIYKITCIINDKVYIGAALGVAATGKHKIGFYRRWREHITNLRLNRHRNSHLQHAWNKYGSDSFRFEILEFCSPLEGKDKEISWMDKYDALNHKKGFNIIRQNLENRTFSDNHRKKIAEALTGKKRPKSIFNSIMKPVLQFDKDNNLIAEFESMSEAFRQTGIQRQDIGKVCLGKLKSAGGYIWKIKR